MKSETIFVGIPSYRDSECQHTVAHLFATAADPKRVFVGICFQYSKLEDLSYFDHFPKEFEEQITIEHISHTEATGPCWARHRTQQLYHGEEYYLSLDSHMRFEKDWDNKLIALLHKCPRPEKAILTSYPPSYELPNTIHRDTNPVFTCAKEFGADGMLRLVGKELKHPSLKPIPACYWISGVSFSYATVISEVPYDPNLPFLFFGEETSMTVRLWTSGWDFFSPGINLVYHLWERTHRPSFRENTDEQSKLEKESQRRVRVLLGIEEGQSGDSDGYGLGKVRTLGEYEEFSGVNFKKSVISEKARYGGIPKESFKEDILNMILAFSSMLK